MTTGRINQVTIFEGLHRSPSAQPASPRVGVSQIGRGVSPGRALAIEPNQVGSRAVHPFATTEFSKVKSAKESIEDNQTLACPLQKEAIRPRSHLMKSGYQYTNVPPIASTICLTNGQQPTDLPQSGIASNKRIRLQASVKIHREGLLGTNNSRRTNSTKDSRWQLLPRQRDGSIGRQRSTNRHCGYGI